MLRSTRYKATSTGDGLRGVILVYLLLLILGGIAIFNILQVAVTPEPEPEPNPLIIMGEVMFVLEEQETRLQNLEGQLQNMEGQLLEIHTMMTDLMEDY